MNMQNIKRYDNLDGLRTFSAVGIVLMHILLNGNYKINGIVFEYIIPSFTDFVFLFMIISAFSMCCGYYEKVSNNKISVEIFYKKRYKKVFPYFAFLCVLDVLISPSVSAFRELFANLTLCFGLLPNPNIEVIGVGWFLGVVFVFYMLFPFYCFLIGNEVRACFVFILTVIFNIFCAEYFNITRANIIYSSPFFIIGGIAYIYKEKIEDISEKYSLIIIVTILCFAFLHYYKLVPSIITLLIVYALILVFSLKRDNIVLNNPVTRFVSEISMEIYLCHMVIYRIVEKMGYLKLFSSELLSYFTTSLFVLIVAIIFAKTTKFLLSAIEIKVKKLIYLER